MDHEDPSKARFIVSFKAGIAVAVSQDVSRVLVIWYFHYRNSFSIENSYQVCEVKRTRELSNCGTVSWKRGRLQDYFIRKVVSPEQQCWLTQPKQIKRQKSGRVFLGICLINVLRIVSFLWPSFAGPRLARRSFVPAPIGPRHSVNGSHV